MRASSASTSASVSSVRRLLYLHLLVAVDGEVRKHFKGSFEAQRFAFLEFDVGYLGLRDRLELLLGDGSAKVAGQHSFHHVLANLLRKTAADERFRNLARTKTRDACQLFVSFGDRLKIASHFFRGNFNVNFPGALWVQSRSAMGVLMSLVIMSGMILGGG